MRLYLSIFLIFVHGAMIAQNKIKPMLCEGELPGDLKHSISDIVTKNNNNDFKKKTLLGIYDIFASGKVVYGNQSWQLINTLGQRILEKNGIDSTVKFYLLRSRLYNAFATDEGYIFATTALLANVKTEDELAFVLCHELSHYLLKHNIKRDNNTKQKLSELKKSIKKLRDQNKKLKSFDEFLRSYYAFSRTNELEADSLGILLFLKAGFSPGCIKQSLSNLQYDQPLFHSHHIDMNLIDSGLNANRGWMEYDSLRLLKFLTDKYYFDLSHLENTGSEDDESEDAENSNYQTHPEWQDRLQRGEAILNRLNPSLINPAPIHNDIVLQSLSEMVITEYKLGNYFSALTYLNILEQKHPGHPEIAQLKGICLSVIYLNFKNDKPNINRENFFDKRSALSHLFYQIMIFEHNKLRHLALYYNNIEKQEEGYKKMCRHYTVNIIGTKDRVSSHAAEETIILKMNKYITDTCIIKHPFMTTVASVTNSIKNDSITQSYKNYSDFKLYPKAVYTLEDAPQRWKNGDWDSVILLSPTFIAIPGRRTANWNDPLVKFERKEYFQNTLIERGQSNRLHYNIQSFENKETLNTDNYNQYYQLLDMINEYVNNYGEFYICPMSVLVTDSIMAKTGCKKMQFIQLSHFRKNTMETLLVLADIYVLPFSLITTLDVSSFIRNEFTKSTAINVVFNLENSTVEYISILETSLKVDNAGITAISQRLISDTKNYLTNIYVKP